MTADELAAAAQDHLWLHFCRLAGEGDSGDPWSSSGARAPTSGTPTATATSTAWPGCSWSRPATAARRSPRPPPRQAETLAYFPLWTYAHPAAIELADRLAGIAPGDLNRVFFTTGGGEAVESAWKLARQYWLAIGLPDRVKVIARRLAYHGTTLVDAHRSPGSTPSRSRSCPLLNGHTRHVGITNSQSCPTCDPGAARPVHARPAPRRSSGSSSRRGPRPSPPCSSSRCRTPAAASSPATATSPRVREICDTPRRAARLRRGDLRVRPAGRLVRRRPASATSPTC